MTTVGLVHASDFYIGKNSSVKNTGCTFLGTLGGTITVKNNPTLCCVILGSKGSFSIVECVFDLTIWQSKRSLRVESKNV
jgi:hypothetical protein